MTRERCGLGRRISVWLCAEPEHCELGKGGSSVRVVVWTVSPIELCEVRLEWRSGLHYKGVMVL